MKRGNRAARAITRFSHKLGFEVRRWPTPDPYYERLTQILRASSVSAVIDVGANEGQFARQLRGAGYGGRIISIEPGAAAYEILSQAAADDPNWDIPEQIALGSSEGDTELIVYNRSDMNSVLPLSAVGQSSFPRLAETGRQTVPMHRLDTIFDRLIGDGEAAVKIDTQGSEREILSGAAGVLNRIPVLQIELGMVQLYDGAAAFEEILSQLQDAGFRMAMTSPVSFDKTTARPIEVDALFLRQ